jgi:carbon-monoxide dehydrogenase small subunit
VGDKVIAKHSKNMNITVIVNDERYSKNVEPRLSLADFLRTDLEMTGTHLGCEQGVCGACTINFNGQTARACTMLAVQADGSRIVTIEGASDSGEMNDLQDAFHKRNALQCGFCTPGMLLTAAELLAQNSTPSRKQIREHISGNYCRCTGYEAIVDAIATVAQARLERTGKQDD